VFILANVAPIGANLATILSHILAVAIPADLASVRFYLDGIRGGHHYARGDPGSVRDGRNGCLAGRGEDPFDRDEYPGDRLAWWMVPAPGQFGQTKTTRRTTEQR